MVISKVLYDNGLLSEEIIDEFKGANNLKLYGDNILTIRGEENFRKLQIFLLKQTLKMLN